MKFFKKLFRNIWKVIIKIFTLGYKDYSKENDIVEDILDDKEDE
jgi:hypothetical protein